MAQRKNNCGEVHSMAKDHEASRDCWCRPQRDTEDPNVWVHNDAKERDDEQQ